MQVLEVEPDMMASIKEPVETNVSSLFDVKVLDGAADVHILQPFDVKTFEHYANNVLIPYIIQQLQNTRRVEIVWDMYVMDSIKHYSRKKRCKIIQRNVTSNTHIPR